MTVDYELLKKQLKGLLASEDDALANSANFVAFLFAEIPDINWAGIYVVRGQELVLGPFQGLPACVRIPLGQGVCGTAAADGRTLRVDNVHDFDGHISCDPASQSEIVVPLVRNSCVFAVLDIDSPSPTRFSVEDQVGIENLCDVFLGRLSATDPRQVEFI